MKTLVYEPPSPNSELREGDQVVAYGEEFDVSDARAKELLADSALGVREKGKKAPAQPENPNEPHAPRELTSEEKSRAKIGGGRPEDTEE